MYAVSVVSVAVSDAHQCSERGVTPHLCFGMAAIKFIIPDDTRSA